MSKLGYSFKELMNLWEEEDKKSQIRMMIDGQNMVLFFSHNNELFGTQEPHRVTFAKLVSPDPDEDPEGWEDDASFMAVNLTRAMTGTPSQHMFKKNDIPKIKVVDKEKAYNMLSNISEVPNKLAIAIKTMLHPEDGEDGRIQIQQSK